MTKEKYITDYQNFKASRIGQYDNLDQQYGYQCFDLVNRYNFYVLNLGWTLNDLYYKLDTQGLYKEVGIGYMLPGDICIWQGEHICIFDSWDSKENKLYFLSQDSIDGTSRRPTGVYWNVTDSTRQMKAFRPLFVDDTPKNDLNDQISNEEEQAYKDIILSLNEQIVAKEKELTIYKDRLVEEQNKNDKLKPFVASRDAIYWIKLNKNDKIYLEKN